MSSMTKNCPLVAENPKKTISEQNCSIINTRPVLSLSLNMWLFAGLFPAPRYPLNKSGCDIE